MPYHRDNKLFCIKFFKCYKAILENREDPPPMPFQKKNVTKEKRIRGKCERGKI